MKTAEHIALLVDNLDESQKWYEDNLNAECVLRDKFYRKMKIYNTIVALVSKNRYDYNHVGILVDCEENLPKNGRRIVHRDGTIGVYVFDNSGHVVEFIYSSPVTDRNV